MSDPSPFGQPDIDRLAGLVFELASQLHVERSLRLALEAALIRSGALSAEALVVASDSTELLRRAREELDRSMGKLMRVVMENGDVRTPLRADVSSKTKGQD
jgi:hypothetical protein